ncbi:MAG TPA: CotH kinase family protein, partial [Verrucomicrobiota bacterium]|nr:CotH kinase family protein [Verrucomicrobiota bacterium]
MELGATRAGLSHGLFRIRLFERAIAGAVLAMVLAGACVDATGGDIVISEVMYQPATFDAREEYIELYNRGAVGYNLNGWKITSGVRFAFPNVVLMPGQYLAVAADLDRFRAVHPGVTNVVGGWEGRLGNNRETITLVDAFGKKQESLTYANEKDWAQRRRGPDDKGHRGWVWYAAHDGGGSSLELINVQFTNQEGQNWEASLVPGGTPGRPNSVARTNIAPIVRNVAHAPAVPRSTQPVTITAHVLDESSVGVEVYLFHRVDGSPLFEQERMWDDGKHGDGAPGDGLYGVVLPPQPADTVVEFYVSATDSASNRRTWPAPVQPEGTQSANCLYQVSDEIEPDGRPFYRLVMTEAERLELAEIGQMPWYWSSDAQMNATFISTEFGETDVRYLAGLRMRGTTSRDPSIPAKSRRVNFPHDRPWRGRLAISLNGLNPHSQVLAGALCRLAGVPAAEARFVRVRENNRQITPGDVLPYGWHAEVEVINNEFVSRQFPFDPNGNLYRADGGNLEYLGENPSNYVYIVTSTGARYANYSKETNVSEDDWSDLISLTRVLNATPASEYAQAVQSAVDVDEWLRYFAVFTMLASTETSLATGSNGDFSLYSGRVDPRFKLVARDLDSTFGMEGGLNVEIYRATNNVAVNRFLTCPEFGPKYNAELRRLSDTLFEPGQLGLIIDRLLADYMPAAVVSAMKDFGAARRAFVLSQIQSSMWVSSSLLIVNWHMRTTVPSVTLYGAVDASRTSKVLVGGREATLNALTGIWSIDGVELLPGVNRVLVCAFDSAGVEVDRQLGAIWYDTGRSTKVSGQLDSNTLWEATKGPYL